MRLVELGLLAYGPFTGQRIDLSRPPPALHLIYGRNEAGKSTTLRAISGALFGIDDRTTDAHLHRMDALRVSVRLVSSAGAELAVVRRKGRVRTLLDLDGTTPIDEALLQHALGGVGEEMFQTMFALDHVRLREGARTLLEGRGDVGESLFDAGTGGRAIHEVLARLEAEAGEIFRERGQKLQLNVELGRFDEAKRRVVAKSLAASAYDAQVAELSRAKQDRDRREQERRELLSEQARLQRWLRVMPLLAHRHGLRERRAALGEVVALAADAAERRVKLERARSEAARDLTRLEAEIELDEVRLEAIAVPGPIAEVDQSRIDGIQARLGEHRKGAADLPKREAALRVMEQEARSILVRLGRGDAQEIPLLDVATVTRIRKLAAQHALLVKTLDQVRRALAAKGKRLELERADGTSAPADAALGDEVEAALVAAVDRVRRAGDVEARLRAHEQAVRRLDATAERGIASLGLGDAELATVSALAVPPMAAVETFARRMSALESESGRLGEKLRESEERAARAEQAADELRRAGDVPTEALLAATRARRDALWIELKEGGAPTKSRRARPAAHDTAAFESAVRDADDVADRLRREADRVARLAAALAELEAAQRACTAGRGALAEAAQRIAAARDEWLALWEPAGVTPRAPAEMREWLTRHARLVELAAERDAKAADLATSRAELDVLRTELARALAAAPVAPPAMTPVLERRGAEGPGPWAPPRADESLQALLDRGVAVLERIAQARTERQRRRDRVDALAREVAELEGELEEQEAQLGGWAQEWADVVAVLGLGPEIDPDAAVEVLDELATLGRKRDEMTSLRGRIEGIREDSAAFAADVRALAREVSPDLAGEQNVAAIAEELLRRWRQARQDADQRREVIARLGPAREERDKAALARASADQALAELVRAAGVRDVSELPAAERRAADAAALDGQLRGVEELLAREGDAREVEALAAETAGVDAATLRARAAAIDDRLEVLDEELRLREREVWSIEDGLKTFHAGHAAAAEALAESQEHLAAVKSLTARWIRLRLAAVILRREIERYRTQHQGPILGRAAQLFPRLTLGEYATLRTGLDDDRLAAIKPSGAAVAVEALSDGARDQLYLALRLASLEHFARTSEPMPLILDDVLIHFDEERTKSALEVLGEVAAVTQVLLFTHHSHVVKLAKRVLGDRLVEHTLDRPRSRAQQSLPLE